MTCAGHSTLAARRLHDALLLLARFHQESQALLRRYFVRLVSEVVDPASVSAPAAPAAGGRTFGRRRNWRAFWRDLPRHRSAMRRLRQMQDSPALVVLLSAKRLHLGGSDRSLRDALASALEPLPGQRPADDLSSRVRKAEHLILCEPEFESSLRHQSNDRDSIVVVDDSLLAYLMLSPAAAGRALVQVCALLGIWLRERRRERGAVSPAKVVAAALYASAYAELFRSVRPQQAVLMTANSFATEMLRIHLLAETRCSQIIEVMHGVPSLDYVRYVESLLDLFEDRGAAVRHVMVPQLPGLPLPSRLISAAGPPQPAVNMHINAYLSARLPSGAGEPDFPGRAAEPFLAATHGRSVLVAVAGGSSWDVDYTESTPFRIECALMQAALARFRERGVRAVLAYAPHPMHPIERFHRHPFFAQHGILVHPDTLLSWLFADLCLALLSSVLFEARHCGVRAFTPLTMADDVFSPELLSGFDHVAPGQSTESALCASVDRCQPVTPEERIDRLRQRVATLLTAAGRAHVGGPVEVLQ